MAATLVAILDDATHPQQCHNQQYLPYLVDLMTGYLLKVKYSPNFATRQKPRGGVATTPIPSLYHDGGISLRVRPRVKQPFLNLFAFQIFLIRENIYTRIILTDKYRLFRKH